MAESFIHVWEFVIDDARRTEFELHYGPRGAWAVLFRRAQGFLGTQLLRDEASPGRYLPIDRWQGVEAYREFRRQFGEEYAALDRQCAAYTRQERAIGSFTESHLDLGASDRPRAPLTDGGARDVVRGR